MELVKATPTVLRLNDLADGELAKLKKLLSFKKKEVQFNLQRHKKQKYFLVSKFGESWWGEKLQELESSINGSILEEDFDGYYTLTGLVGTLLEMFPHATYRDEVVYPAFKAMPWDKVPDKKMRYYQEEAVNEMLANPHSHVEISTGAGKTVILLNLIKNTGLPTVVSTPSASIGRQIYDEAMQCFGKKNVGLFGDGRRDLGKKILISIAKSLAMVEDPEEKEAFKKYQVLIVDEAHQTAAELLSKSALETVAHCPYRWFVSATQMRNDGRDIMLEGIISSIVYEKGIKELQDEGYLAKLSTMVLSVNSPSSYSGANPVLSNQKHIYQNKKIISLIGDIVRQGLADNMPVLILIDEMAQEIALKKELGEVYSFACGSSDTSEEVRKFNDGEVMVLVGTSAVAVGTDIRSNEISINWRANRSEVQVKQGIIGRSTRTTQKKKECKLIDFMIENVPTLKRHALERIKYYKEVGDVEIIDT
jgi:superfamily II DNA or RNA helicase